VVVGEQVAHAVVVASMRHAPAVVDATLVVGQAGVRRAIVRESSGVHCGTASRFTTGSTHCTGVFSPVRTL
jgi:hypothetical protein